eukprot:8420246-Lingulodinium_polyedra.AAC.1
MPCVDTSDDGPHRRRIAPPAMPFVACAARPVGKAELEREEKARAARDHEWARFRSKHAWDEEHPREWDEVRAEAQ